MTSGFLQLESTLLVNTISELQMYLYLQMAVELTSRGYISLNTKVNKQCIFIDSLHYIFLITSFDNLQREKKYNELLLLASSQLANFLKPLFLVLDYVH
jgi:hypothetical protein